MRQRFFSPRVRVRSYEELNAWLLDRCIAWAKAQPHPDVRDRTIWQMFEAERPSLVPYAGPFDGFRSTPVSPSKTCLVRFDNNKYSVMANAVGRPVEVRAYAERIELRQDGRTKDMIFDIPTLIETCSRGITLLPGDVIATGTPSGVAMGFKPPKWLRPGDSFRIEIDGIGAIENRFELG